MAVAIDTSWFALDFIPRMQRNIDRLLGGERHFQIHRVSVHATILPHDSEIWRHVMLSFPDNASEVQLLGASMAKSEALNWQADPDDDLGDAAVLHHLHQQAATVSLLSSVISQSDRGNAATTLTGSALSASINARTQGRPLSSFHRHSYRLSSLVLAVPIYSINGVLRNTEVRALFPCGAPDSTTTRLFTSVCDSSQAIVWVGSQRDNQHVFWQVQVDFVDLFSRRLPTSRPQKRQQTAFNQFLQVSHSTVVEGTSRGNPLPHAKRFNGVRHRTDRKIWVADWKPPNHKTKQDFGNFKSEAQAAYAIDAAFHHYGRPELLNFPYTSLQFLSTRPTALAGLDQKAKVKFVKEEAKLLLAAIAASSPLHSTSTNSPQILELSASPRRCPSGHFRSLSEISSPFSCSGPDEVAWQPEPWRLPDPNCDISTTAVLTNVETLNSMQHAEQGWYGAEDSSSLAAPPTVVNSSANEIQSVWPDSIIPLSPARVYGRSPSPIHFQSENEYALLEHQRIGIWSDDIIGAVTPSSPHSQS